MDTWQEISMVVSIDRMPDATIESHNMTMLRLVAFGARGTRTMETNSGRVAEWVEAKDGCHAPGEAPRASATECGRSQATTASGGWGDDGHLRAPEP
jgi:hypothetical protein